MSLVGGVKSPYRYAMRAVRFSAFIMFLIWCAGLGAAAQFGKMSVVFSELADLYAGHTAVGLGLIVSIVGIVGLVFGTTAGLFVARVGPRRAIVAALFMGAVMSALQSTGLSYPLMIASRVVEGVSHLAIVVVGPTVMAVMASNQSRGFAMTVWSSFFGVTYTLLALFGPWQSETLFLGHAVWMACIGGALAVMLPADPKSEATHDAGDLLRRHLSIYVSPNISAPAFGFFCYTFLYVACLTLVPPEVPIEERAIVAAGMPLISITVSLTLGVWLLRRIRAFQLVQLGYVAAAPGFVALALGWGSGPLMTLAALWLSSALGLVQGASFASIPELNQTSDDRAMSAGAIAQLGNLGTSSGTPVLAAVLAGQGPWGLALVAVMACLLGIALHAVQARRRQILST